MMLLPRISAQPPARPRFRAAGILTLTAILLGSCGGGSGSGSFTPGEPGIDVERVFAGVSFSDPVALLQIPGDDSHWFIVEQDGIVRRFAAVEDVTVSTIVVDLRDRVVSGGERGLLGMAFDPDFATSGRVYLSYTTAGPNANRPVSVLARFESTDGGATLDPDSEVRLLEILQDAANHNGGHVLFGPDGFLYAAFGDGGGANDPNDRAQDTANLLGTIVRLDVDDDAYTPAPGNPFAGNPPCPTGFSAMATDCPEIYAWGLRNPWRFSFDRSNGALWAADVGQGAWEEIDVIENGRNYGWPEREGAGCNPTLYPAGGCSTTGLTDPVAEYDHSLGRSVTGGFVYRGSDIPELRGNYVFADFISGRLFSIPAGGTAMREVEVRLETNLSVSSFAEDQDGELYVVDHDGGTLHRIVADP